MSNGLSNHGSAQHSQGGKQPPAVPLDDGADAEIFTDEDSIVLDHVVDDDSEADNEPPNTDEFEAAAAAELAMAKRREHGPSGNPGALGREPLERLVERSVRRRVNIGLT